MSIQVSDIALHIGTVIKQTYEVKEVHYLGNFGIVYFGINVHTKEQLVIKEFMPYKLANRDMDGASVVCKSPAHSSEFEAAKRRFRQECQIVEQLKDLKKPYGKCVVHYLDSFEENETMYLITERIWGRSIQDYIENGEVFSVRETMKMLVSIVSHIHKQGIIHCDIKPSNIILEEDGKIVLIDFGSACLNGQIEQLNFVSRGFSAPELYHQEKVDQRTDIYSIGAVLYYMLTDYQLPDPDDYDEQEELPRISEFIEISPRLERIILKTLNRKKRERPKSLLELQIILNH